MSKKRKRIQLCVQCRKRPCWRYKNNPGNAYCKRCYHKLWREGELVTSPQEKTPLWDLSDMD